MSNLAEQLMESASAVAALGAVDTEIAALDDASVVAGLALIRDHRRNLQAYEVLLSAEIARRSSHEFGNSGLVRRSGSPTPATFIQSITGVSIEEATKLARLGSMVVDAQQAMIDESGTTPPVAIPDIHVPGIEFPGIEFPQTEFPETEFPGIDAPSGEYPGTDIAPLASAAVSGRISVDAADAIRKGLGRPDDAITVEQLRDAEKELLAQADTVSPEALLKLARIARNRLDQDAVEAGQKRRSDLRYVRRWRRDGMSGGSWSLPDEDGGAEIDTALKLLLASRTGGPRFPETDKDGKEVVKTAKKVALEDPRSMEHVLADGFAQILLNGLHVDPSVVPGASRAAVRVMVSERVLRSTNASTDGSFDTSSDHSLDGSTNRSLDGSADRSSDGSVIGSALLEESLSAITFGKLEEYLCEGGQVGVLFDDTGQTIDVGREQRLFTQRQRTGLGVRDGGCRYPGCEKPPSWCEAHHIQQWARDRGRTDIADGILLCRYHHMLIHDTGGQVIRKSGTYWLRPGRSIDPAQQLVEMPSRNPLVAEMRTG